MKEKFQYTGLDLFKFIAAILILMLHANPFGNTSLIGVVLREVITPVAVPFFFAASGFLWYQSYVKNGDKKAKGSILHTIKLYLIWSGIYFPFVLITWVINNSLNLHSVLFYIKQFFLEGSYQTIWFLNALWLSTAIVYLLLKRFSVKQVFLISIPFYLISCLLSSYNGLLLKLPLGEAVSSAYYSVFETTKNGLLFGFIYVALGALIAKYTTEKSENSKGRPQDRYIYIVICFVITVLEYALRKKYFPGAKSCDITLALVPVTAVLLTFAVNLQFKESPKFRTMRTYSTLLFLTQRIPLTVIYWADAVINKIFGVYILTANSFVNFCLVTLSSFIISYCIICLSKRFKFIKHIY